MDLITLSPQAGSFDKEIDIEVSLSSDVKEVYFTDDDSAPTLAKYLAYDDLNPPNPFIAILQDGKGNVLFDGGFPKWYSMYYRGTYTDFKSLSAAGKYLYNALYFIANPEKEKKVLILNDSYDNASYGNNDADIGFRTSMTKICTVAGFSPTFKSLTNYGGVLNPSYAELDQYACVIYLGTYYTFSKVITDEAISNLVAYRESGNGLFLITDHGDSGGEYYHNINFVASQYGARFVGNYNRNPVNVGYLKRTYGNHPLFENFDDSESIYMASSESKVVITERPSYNQDNLPTLHTKNGVSTFRFLLVKQDESIETISYSYLTNIKEPIQFKNEDIVITETLPPMFKRIVDLGIEIDNTDIKGTLKGLIKYNSEVIGTFSGTQEESSVTWLKGSSIYTVTEPSTFEIEIQSPIRYFKTMIVPIQKIKYVYTLSELESSLNTLDLSKNFKGAIQGSYEISEFGTTSEICKKVLAKYKG